MNTRNSLSLLFSSLTLFSCSSVLLSSFFFLLHSCLVLWLSHLKVTRRQPLLDRLTTFGQRYSAAAILGKVKSAGQNFGFHAFWVGSVEWQLKSQDSHLLGVCRWFFCHWNCTPAWQPSQNWGLIFSTQCSDGFRFRRHSDWTSPVHMVACTWLEFFPPSCPCTSCRCPWLGWSPLAAAGWWWSSWWSYSGWQEKVHAAPRTVCCALSQ